MGRIRTMGWSLGVSAARPGELRFLPLMDCFYKVAGFQEGRPQGSPRGTPQADRRGTPQASRRLLRSVSR